MDVTPTVKMYEAMLKMADALIGNPPHSLEVGAHAQGVRNKRRMFMDWMHQFAALAMREGVNRAVAEAKMRKAGAQDGADRSAIAQARSDAEAGSNLIHLPRR